MYIYDQIMHQKMGEKNIIQSIFYIFQKKYIFCIPQSFYSFEKWFFLEREVTFHIQPFHIHIRLIPSHSTFCIHIQLICSHLTKMASLRENKVIECVRSVHIRLH